MNTTLSLALVVCFIGVSSAITCHFCTYTDIAGVSTGQKGCLDPFDPTSIANVTCTGQCTKVYSKVDGASESITRGCLAVCAEYDESGGGATARTTCCDDKDFCNSATASQVAPVMMLVSAVLAYFKA